MARTSSKANVPVSTPGQVMIAIDRIRPYDRNPRHSTNPEYARIKDSIRHHGVDQAVIVTQRPEAPDYIVHSGGNTRLVIVKELFAETGEARFAEVPCVIKPWESESSVVLAHLRENDLRGNLTFIDRARAVEDVRQLLAAESGTTSITQQRLTEALCRGGYRLSRPGLSLMTYAVTRLSHVIPVALDAGLGRDQVRRIRALDRSGGVVWCSFCAGGEQAFRDVFDALCRRYDGPEWDNAVLQGALETEIAEASDSNLQTIRAAFDAALNHQTVEIPAFVPIKAPPAETGTGSSHEDSSGQGPTSHAREQDSDSNDAGGDASSVGSEPATESLDASPGPDEQDYSLPIEPDDERPTDLKSLRARAWVLAARLAQRNGIGDLVLPLSRNGLGYLLGDVPASTLTEQLDDDGLAQVSLLWWQLAACAEMTAAPLNALLPNLPDGSLLRRALDEDDADLLFKHVWTLDPGHTGVRLWSVLHDRDWEDLLRLMDNYRRLRQCAARTGATLWT